MKTDGCTGLVFDNIEKGFDIYPSVGLRHNSESIRVNFGHVAFKYAIEDHVDTQRNVVWSQIQSTKLDWDVLQGRPKDEVDDHKEGKSAASVPKGGALDEEQMQSPIRKLVLSYLAHHGYARTARAFQVQCEGPREEAVKEEHDMDTDSPQASSSRPSRLDAELDLRARIDIVNAVLKGDIDAAITQTQAHHPTVLEREQGLMLFKLRCRKFVELILEASEALKRVQAEEQLRVREQDAAKAMEVEEMDGMEQDGMDGVGAMDVDDPSPEAHAPSSHTAAVRDASPRSPVSASPSAVVAREALHTAINYGQTLEASYKSDVRAEVRSHLKRTFGVVAFADPLAAGGEVAEMAGQEARARLANELNQAILGMSTSLLEALVVDQ